MYWENVEGSFTFQSLYDNIIQKFNDAIFVEIGVWKGKSAIYMAEKIKTSGKNIKFWAIDIFNGSGYEYDKDVLEGTLLEKYHINIEPVKDFIETLIGDSKELHEKFENESIDFLFLDADHEYRAVKEDLRLWFPKIKKGGIIAGHDYNESSCGVRQAVDEYFLFGAQSYIGGCWIFYK
jgi:predicted O-methyltransferase YrrM